MGRPEYPDDRIVPHYLSLLRADRLNVLTTHAELEGMGRRGLFRQLLAGCQERGVEFVRLDEQARAILAKRDAIPVRDQAMASIDGRSGLVATEG